MGNNNQFLPKNAFYQVWVIFLALIRGGTLVSNWVKVADKDKIVKILKFVKIGLKLLLDIGLEA